MDNSLNQSLKDKFKVQLNRSEITSQKTKFEIYKICVTGAKERDF